MEFAKFAIIALDVAAEIELENPLTGIEDGADCEEFKMRGDAINCKKNWFLTLCLNLDTYPVAYRFNMSVGMIG